MKKVLVLLAIVLGVANMYAQDYDLKGLAKVCKKHDLSPFCDGLSCYFDFEEGYVFFNKLGEKVVVIEYGVSLFPFFSDGLIVVGGGDNEITLGKYGYADKTGKLVIPFEYDYAEPFYKGIAKVSKGGREFYIDKKGKECLSIENDKLSDYVEFSSNGWGALSKERNENGLMMVEKDGKYGWKNGKGDIVIPIQFESASDFSDGLAWVKLNGVIGFVDKDGNSTFNPTVIANTSTNSKPLSTGSLEKDIKTMWYEANKYIDLANSAETKGEKLNYIKKADAIYEKMQNTPNVESVLPLDYIKQYRDTCKQFIEALNAM